MRQCVQFYYLWKKVLVDEHKRLRATRRRREQDYNLRSTRVQSTEVPEPVATLSEVKGEPVEEGGDTEMHDLSAEEEDSLSEASTSVGTFEEHNVSCCRCRNMQFPDVCNNTMTAADLSLNTYNEFSCSGILRLFNRKIYYITIQNMLSRNFSFNILSQKVFVSLLF